MSPSPSDKPTGKKKGILLRLTPEEFAQINQKFRKTEKTGEYSSRLEFLKDQILSGTPSQETTPSTSQHPRSRPANPLSPTTSPVRCRFCQRVFASTREVERHQKNCAANPENRGIVTRETTPVSLATVLTEINNLGLIMEDRLATMRTQLRNGLHGLQVELRALWKLAFQGKRWTQLSRFGRISLLKHFLAEDPRARGFRPAAFKDFLVSLSVQYDPKILQHNQDEVALFLREVEGIFVERREPSTYHPLGSDLPPG